MSRVALIYVKLALEYGCCGSYVLRYQWSGLGRGEGAKCNAFLMSHIEQRAAEQLRNTITDE